MPYLIVIVSSVSAELAFLIVSPDRELKLCLFVGPEESTLTVILSGRIL
jgi:hypothetical protein